MIIDDADEMLAKIDAAIALHEQQLEHHSQELYRTQGEKRLLLAMKSRDQERADQPE